MHLRTVTASSQDWILHKLFNRPYKLRVYEHGGEGPVIILLHGLASSSANWNLLIPLLKQRYRCITIDLLGFGDSPKPDWYEYTMEDHVRSIRAAVKSLKLGKPYTLIGHSLGGLLAARYSSLYPEEISRLVLLSPPVYDAIADNSNRRARQRTSLYLKAYKFIRTHPRVTPDNLARLSRILPVIKFLIIDKQTWKPFVRSLEHCIEQQTFLVDIAKVSAPTDIFYGIFDEVVVPYNIRQIAKIRDVTMHPLKVHHTIGNRYAKAVSKYMTSLPE